MPRCVARVTEHIFTRMTSIMKENGMLTNGVVGDVCISPMARFMKANGLMTKEMDKECCDCVSY